MRHRTTFVTYNAADALAGLGAAGTFAYTIENVTGFLESVTYVKDATAPMGNSSVIGVFRVEDPANLGAFPVYYNAACSASFVAHPLHVAAKSSDATALTTYVRQYFSNETVLVNISDATDHAAGGTVATIVLHFSQPDPVRR